MKYLAYLFVPLLLISLYGGCSSGGGSDGDSVNRCFSELSENPCFDPNEGGTMNNVDNMSVDEVIEVLENRQDFLAELEFNIIFQIFGRSIFLPPLPPTCRWEDSGLVIKTERDWIRYTNNCYFKDNFFEFPDINFSSNMVVVSLDGSKAFGTEIIKVLEFDTELVAVVADTVSDAPSPQSRLFGSSITEVPRRDKPVSFIRVEEICNTVFNLETSDCLAESMLNSCENLICSFVGGSTVIIEPNCNALDCHSLHCRDFGMNFGEVVMGTITDISVIEDMFPIGLIDLGDGDRDVGCTIPVE